jgi:glycine/D-amino acid oxidase-like deaminating enzyme
VARTESQHARLLSWQESMRQVGLTDLRVLDGPAARERLHLPGIRAAGFTPNCAAVQPGRIARGLAEAVVRRGVLLAERTRAVRVLPRRVVTDHGTVRARSIVCATEAYTGRLLGHGRRVLPVGSHVIATEPLPRHFWEGLGWHDRVTVTDSRYHFAYLQRTADDRLVLGGRGADYRYASRTDGRTRPNPTYRRLVKALTDFFPALSGVPVSHYWTGIYGLHRDAEPSVVYDPSTGLGYAGGYGGEGIVLSNLAGRTMAALIADVDRAETRLCWVNRQPRSWEPEPLRFLGVRGASALAMHADNYERRTGRAAPVAGRLLRTLT